MPRTPRTPPRPCATFQQRIACAHRSYLPDDMCAKWVAGALSAALLVSPGEPSGLWPPSLGRLGSEVGLRSP